MSKYIIQFCAYKRSGKSYNSKSHTLGEFDQYPAAEIYKKVEELKQNLDHACDLKLGTIENNNFIVSYVVLDNSEEPLCLSAIVRM